MRSRHRAQVVRACLETYFHRTFRTVELKAYTTRISSAKLQLTLYQWGYDSNIAKISEFSSQNSIFGHAENLLSDLAMKGRKSEEVLTHEDADSYMY
jgi:hypothetical protein